MIRKDNTFMYHICNGLQPRRFGVHDKDDQIIYAQGMQVSEMYIITHGVLGVGYSKLGIADEMLDEYLDKRGLKILSPISAIS